MAFVKIEPTTAESDVIWTTSILSVLCGLALAYWMREASNSLSIYLLGLVHAIAFVPAVILSNVCKTKVIIAGIVCALFPFWGYILIGLLLVGFGAPIANSIIWGTFVAVILKRPLAILIFLAIGIVSNAALFLFMSQDSTNGGFAETIGFWYILTLPAFPILLQYRWQGQPSMSVCDSCGYSYQEPEPMPFCPKCGHKKGDQSATLEESI